MSDEHMNANKYLKGRFINIGNIITDTTNNWQFKVEMEQTNEDSCFADTISVLRFLNQFADENEQLKQQLIDVDKLIDDKIKEYQKYDEYDTEKYYIGTQLLKELKKEIGKGDVE